MRLRWVKGPFRFIFYPVDACGMGPRWGPAVRTRQPAAPRGLPAGALLTEGVDVAQRQAGAPQEVIFQLGDPLPSSFLL